MTVSGSRRSGGASLIGQPLLQRGRLAGLLGAIGIGLLRLLQFDGHLGDLAGELVVGTL